MYIAFFLSPHSSFHFFMLTIALCSLYFSFFQIFSTPSSSSFPLFSTVLCFFLDSISHSLLHGHHSAQADIAPIRHRTGNHSHTRTEPQMSHHATLFTSTHGNFSFYILCIHFSHHVVLFCLQKLYLMCSATQYVNNHRVLKYPTYLHGGF